MSYISYIEDDAFDPNVSLLIQGGPNLGTTQLDLSSYADTANMGPNANYSSAATIFGNNMIRGNQIYQIVSPFTSSGTPAASRFSRAVGVPYTVELYMKYAILPNFAPSGFCFDWFLPGGNRVIQLAWYGNTGLLLVKFDFGNNLFGPYPPNVPIFVQVTIDALDNIYVDVDGVQVYTAAGASGTGVTGTSSVYVCGTSLNDVDASEYYCTPLRMTKGVALPRGSIPVAPWPTA